MAAACAVPGAAGATESAPVVAHLQVEPSVGASLALSLRDGVIVQVYLPGSTSTDAGRVQVASMPSLLQSLGGTEVWTESAVSLRMHHRAAATSSTDERAEGEGGALIILAQFN